jgi:O-methyltransferase involved in polyketide biosynthesis
MGNDRHISESAFLVNESRARNVGLSRDRYAGLWVSEATRRLWEDFSREVYPFDDTELALRNRFFLGVLESSIVNRPDTVFINFAAGFTSYPFLTEQPCRCIEVDFEHVVNFKRGKIEEWRQQGILPGREIDFIPCDLRKGVDVEKLGAQLRTKLASGHTTAFFEGITYYLEHAVLLGLFDLLRNVQRPGSIMALDFWTPDVVTHPVHARFRKFFADRFGHDESDYNLFDEGFLRRIDGYDLVEHTDIVGLERRFSDTCKLVHPQEILPEHYAVLERRSERS